MKIKSKAAEDKQKEREAKFIYIFEKKNFYYFIGAVLIVLIGFLLMIGTENIYDFRKIILAPIIVLLGYGLGYVAIFKKSKRVK